MIEIIIIILLLLSKQIWPTANEQINTITLSNYGALLWVNYTSHVTAKWTFLFQLHFSDFLAQAMDKKVKHIY